MKGLLQALTIIRRTLIVILAIVMIPQVIDLFPTSSDVKGTIKLLEQDGPVTKYKINKRMEIDLDTFIVKTLYVTPKQVVLHYSYKSKVAGGWSLPQNAFKLFDPRGNELQYRSSTSSGNSRGSTGFLAYDKLTVSASNLNLIFEWYDRKVILNLPLQKVGEGQ
ncbi:hypothetical protein [Cohnella sp. WQ 127256]|uniref:hypothetical protein n=1 Tax=Cohnella sp. WQ 127256 TaxID=2938790 RepID=UPI0021184D4C|nr:hypothetical protein [Cohnella sp. WQ 127256]